MEELAVFEAFQIHVVFEGYFVDADGDDHGLGEEGGEFIVGDEAVGEEVGGDAEEAEAAGFERGVDFFVPLFAGEDGGVLPEVEIVLGGDLEVWFEDFEEAVDVGLIGAGVREEERGGLLHGTRILEINEMSTE